MKKRNPDIPTQKFAQIVKEICDERNLNHKQVKEVAYEIMKRLAVGLVQERPILIKGFGSINVGYVKPKSKTYCFTNKFGKVVTGERKPKLKFYVHLDKKIDPTKNY